MRFSTMTLGCKTNQYETGAIENILCVRGHEVVALGEGCDVCILNTCAVTAESVRKSRQAVRRMKKLEPEAKIAVCGCFSQLEPEAMEALEVDIISGTKDRKGFALMVESLVSGGGERKSDESLFGQGIRRHQAVCPEFFASTGLVALLTRKISDTPLDDGCPVKDDGDSTRQKEKLMYKASSQQIEELPPGGNSSRTRALLKIQDGCDNFCTYCVIPLARGHSRSLPPERIAEYAARLDMQGYKEIIITGIEISSYGKDLGSGNGSGSDDGSGSDSSGGDNSNDNGDVRGIDGKNKTISSPITVIDAIQTIHAAAPNVRLRLGSLDPSIMTDDFIKRLSKIPKLCNHFHLSLQSGCDETLRRMGRKYDTSRVKQAISSIRAHNADCGITADLITGFPGETEAEFEQTLSFIRAAKFTDMHVFPFSMRPGTKAAKMPGQLDKKIKKERVRIATDVANDMAYGFKKSQVGKTVEVLFEKEKGGYSIGHSGNYLEIAVKGKFDKNSIYNVRITGVDSNVSGGSAENAKSSQMQGEII